MGMIPYSGKRDKKNTGRGGKTPSKPQRQAREVSNRYQKNESGPKNKLFDIQLNGPLKLFAGACFGVMLFFVLGIGLVHAYQLFITNEFFHVKTIEISGNYRLKSREVLEILKLNTGKNSLAFSIDVMEADLARNPWISGLSIKRTLPDRFDIAITEREPKYWVNRGGVLYYADASGAPIMPVTTHGFSSLPALEIEHGAETLARRLPGLVDSLAEADLPLDIASSAWLRLSAGGTLELRASNTLRISIGIDNWAVNLRHLNKVMNDLSRRGELRSVAEIKAHGNNVWVSSRAGS